MSLRAFILEMTRMAIEWPSPRNLSLVKFGLKHIILVPCRLTLQVLGAHIDSWASSLARYAVTQHSAADPSPAAAEAASACAERLLDTRQRFLKLRTCFDAGGLRRAALDSLRLST
jgi:hypothetical protein